MERACRPLRGLQVGAASAEDEDRLLQRCEPAWRLPQPVVCLSWLRVSSQEGGLAWTSPCTLLPACGQPKALKTISRTIRRWTLHHHSDKTLQDLARTYNPYIQGWINYFGHFYRQQLRPTLLRIDAYLIRWARWKFKRLRGRPKGAREWLVRVRRANPALFAHWQFYNVGSRTPGAV